MIQSKSAIISNRNLRGNYWHCVLHAPDIATSAEAGQFVAIKISDSFDPLLRRPLSIHSVRGSSIELLYEVVGRATQMLSQKKTGDVLDILGPLGNGFSYDGLSSRTRVILVAGGMGVAPLVFLAQQLKTRRLKHKPFVFIGARTKQDILCEKEFKRWGCEIIRATDDGSCGMHGRVTEAFANSGVLTRQKEAIKIYACGPKPMLCALSRIACALDMPIEVSLEEHMACGIGACLGCVVKLHNGFKRVCKDGPVFDAREIVW